MLNKRSGTILQLDKEQSLLLLGIRFYVFGCPKKQQVPNGYARNARMKSSTEKNRAEERQPEFQDLVKQLPTHRVNRKSSSTWGGQHLLIALPHFYRDFHLEIRIFRKSFPKYFNLKFQLTFVKVSELRIKLSSKMLIQRQCILESF